MYRVAAAEEEDIASALFPFRISRPSWNEDFLLLTSLFYVRIKLDHCRSARKVFDVVNYIFF